MKITFPIKVPRLKIYLPPKSNDKQQNQTTALKEHIHDTKHL